MQEIPSCVIFQQPDAFLRIVRVVCQIGKGVHKADVELPPQFREAFQHLFPALRHEIDPVDGDLCSGRRGLHHAGRALAVIIHNARVADNFRGVHDTLIGEIFVVDLVSLFKENAVEKRPFIQLVPQKPAGPVRGKTRQKGFSLHHASVFAREPLLRAGAEPVLKRTPDNIRAVFFQERHHVGVCPRLQKIVAVRKAQVFPRGRPQSCVFCRRRAAVFLVDDPNAAVPLGIGVADGTGIVGGAVVNEDDLQLFVVLRQDAVQALRQVGRHVIHRHNDRNHVLHS